MYMRLKQLEGAFCLPLNIPFLACTSKKTRKTNQPPSSLVCGEVAPLAFGKWERPVAVLAAPVSG